MKGVTVPPLTSEQDINVRRGVNSPDAGSSFPLICDPGTIFD
jgi:hypothetical protein